MSCKFLIIYAALLCLSSASLLRLPISRRQYGTCLPAPPPQPVYIADPKYLACFPDPVTPRTIDGPQVDPTGNIPQICGDTCGNLGYSLFGVKYGR